MAKSLRSKVKRHFRAQKGETVKEQPWRVDAEAKRQAAAAAALAAPKPEPDPRERIPDAAGPSGMEGLERGGRADADALPEITTKNPAKLLKKLRNRRLAAVKGVVLSKGKKRAKPLAGANQFHKKVGSKKKR